MTADVQTMAHLGQTPWHGLGSRLEPGQPLEVWAKAAGMDWSVRSTSVRFAVQQDGPLVLIQPYDDHKVLYRSDTLKPLSVVGSRYQVVQPLDVLEFYRDLIEVSGFEMETAGVLKEGRKFWALARTGKSASIKGTDLVQGYMLLASSCDGSLSTVATPTTVRVVCSNTLAAALNGSLSTVRVPHNTTFNPSQVKSQLGIAVSGWDNFMYRMKELAERKVNETEAERFIKQVFQINAKVQEEPQAQDKTRNPGPAMKQVKAMFDGQGRGAELTSAKGTAWGLLNAVTEYVDHQRRARNQDSRLDSAWFGLGAAIKQRALDQAVELVD
ncbi:MAG: DUF932 domain-containing protein [Proteobacteria bacterium]|nr:DUF932 domain-containing protein [Pseudomonadota bacterium]